MTKKVKSKALEIMALALEFNGRSTKCECTGSKPTIFVNFSGHTCELDVNIYTQGWTFHNTNARNLSRPYIDIKRAQQIIKNA